MVLAALAGCARPRPEALAVRPTTTTADLEAMVRLALQLDAASNHDADTLYSPDAVVVANAQLRSAAPRFAGVGPGGRVTIAATTITVQPRVAWILVDYRWLNTAQRLAEAGRATIILEQRSKGWRIVHAHSSQLLPWSR